MSCTHLARAGLGLHQVLSHFVSCLFPGSSAFSGLSHISQCQGTFFFSVKMEKRHF